MINLLPEDLSLTLAENPALEPEVLWRITIMSDGSVTAQIPPKGNLDCMATLLVAQTFRRIAKRLEETVQLVEAELYGKDGHA